MRNVKKSLIIILSMVLIYAMAGCGGGTDTADGNSREAAEENSAAGVNLRDMLKTLYTSEDDLELAGLYTSTADIPDTQIDPELVGTWKLADGSTTYIYQEDGTAKTADELYGDTESTYTCFSRGDYQIIAEDLEMVDYSNDEETTVPIVSYNTYKIENDVLYLTVVESADEYSNQNITQIIVLYKADDNGDISDSVRKNPVAPETYYGEWTYGDNEEGRFTIDEKGFTLDGGETLPLTYNESGKMVIGDGDNSTEYSVSLALERLYDTDDGKKVTDENYALGIFYTGADEKDRPNLADAMDDWHAEYDYDQFYFSLNAKTAVN